MEAENLKAWLAMSVSKDLYKALAKLQELVTKEAVLGDSHSIYDLNHYFSEVAEEYRTYADDLVKGLKRE